MISWNYATVLCKNVALSVISSSDVNDFSYYKHLFTQIRLKLTQKAFTPTKITVIICKSNQDCIHKQMHVYYYFWNFQNVLSEVIRYLKVVMLIFSLYICDFEEKSKDNYIEYRKKKKRNIYK